MEIVWRALSSPHRRQILDLLREGPLTTSQLTHYLPDLSRFAVMQHLQVLEQANLVLPRREGRQRLNFSNAIPIREVLGRWLSEHSDAAAETALHLRRYAETPTKENDVMHSATVSTPFRCVKIEMEMTIDASPERVYNALVHEMDNWWPHRFRGDSTIVVDARVGGIIEEQFVEGGGALFGTIAELSPGRRLVTVSPSVMNSTYSSHNVETFTLLESGQCLYAKKLTLFGDVPEELEKMFRDGSKALMEDALRGYLASGKQYQKEARS